MHTITAGEEAPQPTGDGEGGWTDRHALDVQKFLRKRDQDYGESWLNEPLPLLNNQTPCEAAKTPEGREKLELLLREVEGTNDTNSDNLTHAPERLLREQGGLNKGRRKPGRMFRQ